ncbi:hypothetical protein CO009_03560 [Candidatus Shapirobacteria bacterium CG_4_8_14_3_um_filter_35_11]|uniref:Type II secretion system protein GspG C-terminal domain-containing protein n=1 Tax=Candidatus Shapirobacteria bacterium CG_4_8_14_3_um_filter_35_11 TaxID=1974874 RepID=A0A2M8GIX3_9BACT|nr:MAG: hypothetical protein CO009_03560 [Candidatus Shapirobacteria bacterium CG_4_8_14_3_um_filter_35_11]
MNNNINKDKFGFTLFELLVSISIIAILTAIASMSFSGAQKKARDARRVSDMNFVQKAAEQYYSFSNYVYPSTTATPWTATNSQRVLDIFPRDPKLSSTGTGWTGYVYSVATTYCACAAVENTASGNSSTKTCTFNTSGAYYCVKSQQ